MVVWSIIVLVIDITVWMDRSVMASWWWAPMPANLETRANCSRCKVQQAEGGAIFTETFLGNCTMSLAVFFMLFLCLDGLAGVQMDLWGDMDVSRGMIHKDGSTAALESCVLPSSSVKELTAN